MGLIFYLTAFISLILLIYYHWSRRHLYATSWKLNGPVALPIIGNGHMFIGKDEDVLEKLIRISEKYETPGRFWFGPCLVLFYFKPKHIEKILTSKKMAYKHDVYQMFSIFLGDGFVNNLGGEKYKQQKKIFQPLLNVNFVNNNMDVYQKHVDVLIEKLEKHIDGNTFDIHHIMHNCLTDIIGETIYGTIFNAQNGHYQKFLNATIELYDNLYYRLVRPWLHPDFIFNLTSTKKNADDLVEITTACTRNAINEARKRIKVKSDGNQNHTPLIDTIAKYIEENPNSLNDEDFSQQMFTLFLASEDTINTILSMFCVCLGMYPEYQNKLVREIRSAFGESTKENVTYEDLIQLKYLDMCYRDVLRLMPIAPIILRQLREDFTIDNVTIPKGCGVVVSIYSVHRDSEFWQNPEHFHPDHFLPEFTKNRHPYAYVPFSAGMRGCQGKTIANGIIKFTIIKILQRYEIEADGKFPDVKLKCDISVRSCHGYNLRLKKRIWT